MFVYTILCNKIEILDSQVFNPGKNNLTHQFETSICARLMFVKEYI